MCLYVQMLFTYNLSSACWIHENPGRAVGIICIQYMYSAELYVDLFFLYVQCLAEQSNVRAVELNYLRAASENNTNGWSEN